MFDILMSYLPEGSMAWLNVLSLVVAGASVAAAALAKLTANKTDDKVAGWLEKLHNILGGVGTVGLGLSLEQKRTGIAPSGRETVVVDHRTK